MRARLTAYRRHRHQGTARRRAWQQSRLAGIEHRARLHLYAQPWRPTVVRLPGHPAETP